MWLRLVQYERIARAASTAPLNTLFLIEIIGCSLPQGLLLLMHQKKQKCFQQKGFFAARAFPLQSVQNHGLGKFAPCCAAPASRFSKHSLCPSCRTAHHVLPAFARSCPADVQTRLVQTKTSTKPVEYCFKILFLAPQMPVQVYRPLFKVTHVNESFKIWRYIGG